MIYKIAVLCICSVQQPTDETKLFYDYVIKNKSEYTNLEVNKVFENIKYYSYSFAFIFMRLVQVKVYFLEKGPI